ncbi:tellurite resistance TerB C-terminal domain-containing protein [Arcicella rosea]|uniref:TerB-C domain-containing protein n=1 Tax=Arcicella rosea TaxID=502909 RepID=A0A841ET90_9BACT|nr:tellurite resistance TerB C-terminal domain-containing protein [Arcicella rosea]MBB6004619.1 hypothetical protein [Arcicella rosea]
MAILIGLIVFLFCFIKIFLKQNNKKAIIKKYLSSKNASLIENSLDTESLYNRTHKANEKIKTLNIYSSDDSIIDVSSLTSKIIYENTTNENNGNVPYWKHQYVYSFNEINSATDKQKEFYYKFKKCFLNSEYLDLEENSNYSFVLMYDFLREYDNDIGKLENLFLLLGRYYPKTKSYCNTLLNKKKDERNRLKNITSQFNTSVFQSTYSPNYEEIYWKLGDKYKKRLSLNNEEVTLLNKLWNPNNNFCNIEFCLVEVLRFFLFTIKELNVLYLGQGSSLEMELLAVADVIAKKQFKYRKGSANYKYCIESSMNDIYNNIFKHCENIIREYFGHKRKINVELNYEIPLIKIEYETRIIVKLQTLLPSLISKITPPDDETEIELNSQNTTRWKIKFEELTTKHSSSPKNFVDSIIFLGNQNIENPSVENIFFEASKFIAKYDNESALILYIYYLYYDLVSTVFDNRQLTKTIQKSLFKTNEQLRDFEKIVSELIKSKDLENALKEASKIYEIKRKKIQLDTDSIKEVQKQHSGTVELLNEYLKDDYEDETITIKSQEINNDEIEIEITPKNENNNNSSYLSELSLNQIQIEALELFLKSNLVLLQSEIEVFAKLNGIFKNQLIESINDNCYDVLDDILIEEDDEYYAINLNYFQKITVSC